MESKTKHRILGIIVMAGIAVLMYPILQANTDKLPDEQQMVKAPPFPDQTIQVSASAADAEVMPPDYQIEKDTLDQGVSMQSANLVEPVTASAPEATTPERGISGPMSSNDDNDQCVIIDVRPPHLASTSEAATPKSTNENAIKAGTVQAVTKQKHKSAVHKTKVAKHKQKSNAASKPVIHSKITDTRLMHAYRQQPLTDDGLMQLKKAAWVIQLGSFKNKANALKLVNKLRSRGYRAFIQKYSADTGQQTRVFVGPEHQQKSARLVAAELKKGMKLHGIVISYKPFTL